MHQTIGLILIYIGLFFITIGVIGIFRFKNFYTRILVASLIDTVGLITLLTGVVVRNGLSFFALKGLLIIVVVLTINPLITHSITRSAYFSGYRMKKE